MLTYLKSIAVGNGRQLKAYSIMRAGQWIGSGEFSIYAIPAGRYDVYRQDTHRVLVAAGQDPHDCDGTYYYVHGLTYEGIGVAA